MLFDELFEQQTKPPKRPKQNLKFKNIDLWARDIKIEKGDFDIHKDKEGNLYAVDKNCEKCYGKWITREKSGISFYNPKPFRIFQHKKKKITKVNSK